MTPILESDIGRYHRAASLIEADLHEAYFTCRQRYGADVAGTLLVFALRQKMNDKPEQWPAPEDLQDKVNNFLRENGLL